MRSATWSCATPPGTGWPSRSTTGCRGVCLTVPIRHWWPCTSLHNIERYDVDGAVWSVDYGAAGPFPPSQLREMLNEEGSDVFTAGMLDLACIDLRSLQSIAAEDLVLFIERPSFNDRIVNQFARFSLMSRAGRRLRRPLASSVLRVVGRDAPVIART